MQVFRLSSERCQNLVVKSLSDWKQDGQASLSLDGHVPVLLRINHISAGIKPVHINTMITFVPT